MNLAMALEMSAECFPDRIAVSSDGKNMTYGELLSAAKRAAAEIKASGVKYVGLLDISSLAVPVAVFASAFAGVPYVPLNYRLTKPELEELLERIAPAYLVTDTPAISPLTVPAGVQVVLREDFLKLARSAGPQAESAPGEPSDVAIQLFTSGTTGKPKAAVLRHENLMSYILGTVDFGSADETDAVLVAVPP